MKNNKLPVNQTRSFSLPGIQIREINEEKRTIETAVASDEPVLQYFGYEKLSMKKSDADISYLKTGRAPLLLSHRNNAREYVGVVESAKIDKDNILRASLRFSKSDLASEIFQDFVDGIRSTFSIGYYVTEFKEEEEKIDDLPVYLANKWSVKEVSVVPLPADENAFVGRSNATKTINTVNTVNNNKQEDFLEARSTMGTDKNKKTDPIQDVDPSGSAEPTPTPSVNVEQIRAEETQRVRDLIYLGEKYGFEKQADGHIREGKSVRDFKEYILDHYEERSNKQTIQNVAHVDHTEKERKRYSLSRAVQAAITGDWRDAGLEREMSDEIGKQFGKRGIFVPESVLETRAGITAGTDTSGGEFTGVDHRSDLYVPPVFNKTVLLGLGAMPMGGLRGNQEIPVGGAPTVGWLSAENADLSETTPTTSELTASPKDVGAFITVSRRALLQSDPNLDPILKNDLLSATRVAIDTAGIAGAGSSGVPQGIIGLTGAAVVAIDTDGGAPTYEHIRALIREVQVDNQEGYAFLTNPKVVYKLSVTPVVSSTDSRMVLTRDDQLVGFPLVSTNSVPSNLTKNGGSSLSAIIHGAFSTTLLCSWGAIELDTSKSHGDTFKAAKVTIRVIATVDVIHRYASAYSMIVDAVTT